MSKKPLKDASKARRQFTDQFKAGAAHWLSGQSVKSSPATRCIRRQAAKIIR